MTNDFIPYTQALQLKELGFDEKCLAYWFNETPPNPEGQCLVYYQKPYDNVKITNGIIRVLQSFRDKIKQFKKK